MSGRRLPLPSLQVMQQAEIIAEAIARDDDARCAEILPSGDAIAKAAVFELAHKVGDMPNDPSPAPSTSPSTSSSSNSSSSNCMSLIAVGMHPGGIPSTRCE
jgi:Holliday junction resolvasome RuvABC DNA-binding subunit